MQGLTLLQALLDHVPARLEKIPSGKLEPKPVPMVAEGRTGTFAGLRCQQPSAHRPRPTRRQTSHAGVRRRWLGRIASLPAARLAGIDRSMGGTQSATAGCRESRTRFRLVTYLHDRRFEAANAQIRIRRLSRTYDAPPKAHRNPGRRFESGTLSKKERWVDDRRLLKTDAPLSLPPRPLHAAGSMARGLAGIPADSLGSWRPHPANAGGRRSRNRPTGRPARLRPRPSTRPAIPELLGRRTARRSGAVAALQPERHSPDYPALSLHAAAYIGGAGGRRNAFSSRRSALCATAQPLGRPLA